MERSKAIPLVVIFFILLICGCTSEKGTDVEIGRMEVFEELSENLQDINITKDENISPKDEYPHIRDIGEDGVIKVEHSFLFQGRKYVLDFEINKNTYIGAVEGNKNYIYYEEPDPDWEKKLYMAFINDPKQDEFYDEVLTKLRELKKELDLTEDEYLELIVAFVQSVEYDYEKANKSFLSYRFPVETVVENKGVCADTSLLLAGLLSRENYNVSVLIFDEENHAAVGISCPLSESFMETGYCYIETTDYFIIGILPKRIVGNITIRTRPKIIQVGNGTRTFRLINETKIIQSCLNTSYKNIEFYKERINPDDPDVNIQEYNTMVEIYNENVRIYDKILFSGHDRKGLIEWLLRFARNVCPDKTWA